jgi:hypothetical protein
VGSVTDQDGDSSWEVTASLSGIRRWANNAAVTSYEIPRIYRLCVTPNGFGDAKRLKYEPVLEKSDFYLK